MKRERTNLCFIFVCLAVCAVLSLGMLFFGPSEGRANERLSPAPRLLTADGVDTDFLSDTANYVSDHFILRQECITARNSLAALLGGSLVDDVILGADGWLYYTPTLDDYTGLGAMSDGELAAAARNLYLMREYCEERGIAFLFVPAPNKNSLYADAMPDYGSVSSEHDAQRLLRLLDEEGVPYLDLFRVFQEQTETLYFEHDSHWNSKGAALAADEINAALGRYSDYFADGFDGEQPHTGDLYEMLYPAGRDGETDPVYGGGLTYTREGTDTRADSITINTTGGSSGTLLAFRDSFGNLLYPYLADSFAAARFSRMTSYNLTLAENLGADYVLVELVERNLDYLLRFTPIMPAPARALALPETVSGSIELAQASGSTAPEGYALYTGTLARDMDGSPIYLWCGGTAYEAFLTEGGGFAAYLPETETPALLLYYVDNRLTACSIE